MGPELARHARLLRAITAEVERDQRMRVFLVGCSLGRGAGDALSDVDANLTVRDQAWPQILADVDAMLRRAGEVVDVLRHELPEVRPPHRRFLVQYRDGVQLDLVVQTVSSWSRHGRAPDVVALHDPEGMTEPLLESRGMHAGADDLREWSLLGWEALSHVVKYLRRDSPWEALDRLTAARLQAWRLWAAAQRVELPALGVTAILDAPGTALPPRIEETVARLDRDDLLRAARACADVLDDAWAQSTHTVVGQPQPPPALRDHVRAQLEAMSPS
jgi:hypothetical protein